MFDKETYRARFPDVQGLYDMKTKYDSNPNLQRIASEIAVATGVPVVVCFEYIGELVGYTDQLRKYIRDINAFYGVTSEDNTVDTGGISNNSPVLLDEVQVIEDGNGESNET